MGFFSSPLPLERSEGGKGPSTSPRPEGVGEKLRPSTALAYSLRLEHKQQHLNLFQLPEENILEVWSLPRVL